MEPDEDKTVGQKAREKLNKVGEFTKKTTEKAMVDPVKIVEDRWDNILKKFWYIVGYAFFLGSFLLFGPETGLFNLITLIALLAFPFFVLYQMLSFIPTIKIGNKVIFSRNMLSTKNQVKWGYKISYQFGRRLHQISPQLFYIAFSSIGFFFMALVIFLL